MDKPIKQPAPPTSNPTKLLEAARAALANTDATVRRTQIDTVLGHLQNWSNGSPPCSPLVGGARRDVVASFWNFLQVLREKNRITEAVEAWAQFRQFSSEAHAEVTALAAQVIAAIRSENRPKNLDSTKAYLIVLEALSLPPTPQRAALTAHLDAFFELICVDRKHGNPKRVMMCDRILVRISPLLSALPKELAQRVGKFARAAEMHLSNPIA